MTDKSDCNETPRPFKKVFDEFGFAARMLGQVDGSLVCKDVQKERADKADCLYLEVINSHDHLAAQAGLMRGLVEVLEQKHKVDPCRHCFTPLKKGEGFEGCIGGINHNVFCEWLKVRKLLAEARRMLEKPIMTLDDNSAHAANYVNMYDRLVEALEYHQDALVGYINSTPTGALRDKMCNDKIKLSALLAEIRRLRLRMEVFS